MTIKSKLMLVIAIVALQLNEIGDDGWELVAVIPSEVAGGNGHLHTRATCYFKRRLN